MSIKHLDILRTQLPDLFQDRTLASGWDNDFLILPFKDPESEPPLWGESNPWLSFDVPPTSDLSAEDLEMFYIGGMDTDAPINILDSFEQTADYAIPERVLEIFGSSHSGSPVPYSNNDLMPPPDSLAFYLPFHYYHPHWWGIYLLFDGVAWLANEIQRRSGGKVDRAGSFRAARLFLYYHEAFHHKTECFATRLEMTHRKPLYKTEIERLYQDTIGKPECLEEGLANATGLRETRKKIKNEDIGRAIEEYIEKSPPGYDQGELIEGDFVNKRCEFAEKNQARCFPYLPTKDPAIWRTAPHMFNGISNIKSRVNYLLPRNSPLLARIPARLS